MGEGIYVNCMTKAFAGYVKAYEAKQQTKQGGLFRSAAEKIAERAAEASDRAADRAEVEGTNRDTAPTTESRAVLSVEDMTMEEYKQYISDKISQIPIHPSQAGWQWHIDITEAGFEAMKNDPAYEKYVLDTIRTNFSFQDPFGSRTYSILHFGATKEEARGEIMSYDSPAIPHRREKSFWERRMERSRMYQKQFEKLQQKRALARKWGLPEPVSLDMDTLLKILHSSE